MPGWQPGGERHRFQDLKTRAVRRSAARALAQATGAVVVLKGHETVVSDGQSTWRCAAGGPNLAIPGSGDVLRGVIAGLMSQGMSTFDAARLGVQLHAVAGDRWARERPFGLFAMELAAGIPLAARRFARSRQARGLT